jgi:hypothetical protein
MSSCRRGTPLGTRSSRPWPRASGRSGCFEQIAVSLMHATASSRIAQIRAGRGKTRQRQEKAFERTCKMALLDLNAPVVATFFREQVCDLRKLARG